MDRERIERAAAFMVENHRAGGPYEGVPEAFRPRDLDEAYAAQARFLYLSADGAEPDIVGYKIATTSRVIQELVGIDQPTFGTILAGRVHESPARLEAAHFMHLGVECEIAFRMARDLGPGSGPHDRATVADAVASCHAAFELIEDRCADYGRMEAMSLITDNAWNAGIVLGPAVTDWQTRDIGNLGGRLTLNGAAAGEGVTRDALGHPLEGLAWIANTLTARGGTLGAGLVTITGSIIATRFVAAGDHARYEVDELGAVELNVT